MTTALHEASIAAATEDLKRMMLPSWSDGTSTRWRELRLEVSEIVRQRTLINSIGRHQ